MTYRNFMKPALKPAMAVMAALTLTTALPAASAMAADTTVDSFTVSTTTDGRIRLGVKAFKKGDFSKSVRLHRAALKTSLSPRKAGIAQSNLCAAYAKLEMMDEAEAACTAALELRPDYAPAQANKAALTIRLAQK